MLLLVVTMALSYLTSSAQSLSPKVLVQDKDTFFVFSIPQSKFIAQRLSAGFYCDSIVEGQDSIIYSLNESVILNKQKIGIYKQKITNFNQLSANDAMIIKALNSDLDVAKSQIKKQKLYVKLSLIGMIVFGSIAIIK